MTAFVAFIFCLSVLRAGARLWALTLDDLPVAASRVDLVGSACVYVAIAIWAGMLLWGAA